jgi:hypothetical protein
MRAKLNQKWRAENAELLQTYKALYDKKKTDDENFYIMLDACRKINPDISEDAVRDIIEHGIQDSAALPPEEVVPEVKVEESEIKEEATALPSRRETSSIIKIQRDNEITFIPKELSE